MRPPARRITGVAKHGVQAPLGQVAEHQVDHRPRVVGLLGQPDLEHRIASSHRPPHHEDRSRAGRCCRSVRRPAPYGCGPVTSTRPAVLLRLSTPDAQAPTDLASISDDLQTVLRCCERLVDEPTGDGAEPEDLVLEAVWTTAVRTRPTTSPRRLRNSTCGNRLGGPGYVGTTRWPNRSSLHSRTSGPTAWHLPHDRRDAKQLSNTSRDSNRHRIHSGLDYKVPF